MSKAKSGPGSSPTVGMGRSMLELVIVLIRTPTMTLHMPY